MSHDSIIEFLKENAISITSPRIYVLSLFMQKRSMLCFNELIEISSKKMSRVTLYRTLNFFSKTGLLYKIVDINNTTHYALNEGAFQKKSDSTDDHFHFKCLKCGSMVCLPEKQKSIDLPEGYVKTGASLLLMGYCMSCSNKKQMRQKEMPLRNNYKEPLKIY